MSFRDNLLRLRTEHNMTQEQLATRLGVSRQSVAKWEADRSYPEMDKLIKMTGIFGCTLDELVLGRAGAESDDDLPTDDTNAGAGVVPPVGAGANENGTLPDGAPTSGTPAEGAPAGNASALRGGQEPAAATDEHGYDAHMRSFALRMAWGVAAIILGVALMVFADFPAETGEENDAVALAILFVGVAAGLALILPAAMGHATFKRQHPVIRDFYSLAEKTAASQNLTRAIVGGIALIFLGVFLRASSAGILMGGWLYMAIEGLGADLSPTVLEHLLMETGSALMLMCIAAGVWLFIYFGIMHSRVHVSEYRKDSLNEIIDAAGEGTLDAETVIMQELSPEERRLLFATEGVDGFDGVQVHSYLATKKRRSKLISGICGIIMILATIVGLCLLFGIPHSSPYFWMAWVVGGLCCGIVSVAVNTFGK